MSVRPKIYSNVTWDQMATVKKAAKIRGVRVAEFVRTVVLSEAEEEIEAWVSVQKGDA